MAISIAPATPEDVPQIWQFVVELAIYEREPDAVIATKEDFHRVLFCESPRAYAVMCRDGDVPIGFALYFYNFSTWLGRHGLYLEDLYVTPEHRGKGAGKALLQHLAGIAVAEGCGRFEWSVLDWNQPAIDFYESMDAKPQSEWVGYRLTGEALQALASRD
ncbi:MAG: GNAT family N-acetyltransferase [Luminiphilus sp.]|jgi:GNAT superfamily N-acetyltransferase